MKYKDNTELIALRTLGNIEKGDKIIVKRYGGAYRYSHYDRLGCGSRAWIENPINFKLTEITNWRGEIE